MIPRLLAISFLGTLAIGAADPPPSYRNATLTGCLDEQAGPQYVLRGFTELKLMAKLEPVGFPVQGFAKYLGKRVRLQGRLSTAGEPAVMRVKNIKALSGPCAPREETRKAPGAAGRTETLVGCVDEQPGPKYILRGAEKRELRAELEAVGFAVQNFARFLGHSVSIKGELTSDRDPPLLRVQQIGDIQEFADHCIPR